MNDVGSRSGVFRRRARNTSTDVSSLALKGVRDLDEDVAARRLQVVELVEIRAHDDADRDDLKSRVEAALSGATDVLWITDKRGKDVAIPSAKIAYIELKLKLSENLRTRRRRKRLTQVQLARLVRSSQSRVAKMEAGPMATMTVLPNGAPKMGGQLGQWFLYCAIVGVFAAYVSGRALAPGTHYLSVFRFAGVTAFCCYGMALLQNSIWFKRRWRQTLVSMFDALIYALVTAGTFGWLWPG